MKHINCKHIGSVQSDAIQEKIKLPVLESERLKTKCESPKKRVSLESIRVTRSTTPSRSPTPTGETTPSTLTNPRTKDPSTISSTTVSGDTEQPAHVKLPKITLRHFNVQFNYVDYLLGVL